MSRSASPLRRVLPLFRPHARRMALGTLLALAGAAAAAALLALSGWFIVASAIAGASTAAAWAFNMLQPAAAIRALAVARTGFRYLGRVVSHDATFGGLAELRVWTFGRLAQLSPGQTAAWRDADLANRLTADVDALDALYLRVLQPAAVALIVAGAVLGLIAAAHLGMAALVGAAMLAAAVLLPWATGRLTQAASGELARRVAALRVRAVDGVAHLPELTLYQALPAHAAALAADDDALRRAQRRLRMAESAGGALAGFAGDLAVGGALLVGIDLVAAGQLAGPWLALLVLAVMGAFEALGPVAPALQFRARASAAAARVVEAADAEPTIADPAAPRKPAGADLTVADVRFAWPGAAAPALDGASFDLPAGRKLAILGPSGSGKSSLAQLLVRFMDPQGGAIRLGGVDLRDMALDSLRRRVAFLTQRDGLLDGTIRENLLLAKPGADEAESWAALRAARLDALIAELPDGLDAYVGEFGLRLSGGEARRLALARCLLRGADILVLDEPTEGLDPANRRAIMDAIRAVPASVVLIAHDPTGLDAMDEILFLENGRVVERGAPAALRRAGGRYAELAV